MQSQTAGAESEFTIQLQYRGQSYPLRLSGSCSVLDLGKRIQAATAVALSTQKLIIAAPKRTRSRPAIKPSDEEFSQLTVFEVGLQEGTRATLSGVTTEELHDLNTESEAAAKLNARTRGFEAELRRERRRRADDGGASKTGTTSGPPSGKYTFGDYRVLEPKAGRTLTPSPAEAKQLLYKLAGDPGVVAIMNKHKWSVGELTEMPPEGKVGVSPACLLGFNKNKGEEICLRLRTDDMKGFRKYDVIMKTLLHELTHMVWSDHDNNFKALDSQLNKEYQAYNWTKRDAGRTGASVAAEFAHDWGQEGGYDSDDAMTATKRSSGGALGAGPSGEALLQGAAAGPREAARLAALRRAQAPHSTGPPPAPPPGAPPVTELAMPFGCGCPGGCSGCDAANGDSMEEETGTEQGARADGAPMAMGCTDGSDVGPEKESDSDVHADPESSMTHISVKEGGRGATSGVLLGVEGAQSSVPDGLGGEMSEGQADVDMSDSNDEVEDPASSGASTAQSDTDMQEPLGAAPRSTAEPAAAIVGTVCAAGASVLTTVDTGDDAQLEALQMAANALGDKVRAGVERIVSQAPSFWEAELSLSTLNTILNNVMQAPSNPKFRYLRWANNAIQARIRRHAGAVEVLKTAGFAEEAGSDPGMRLTREDPGRLRLVLDTVQIALSNVKEMNAAIVAGA